LWESTVIRRLQEKVSFFSERVNFHCSKTRYRDGGKTSPLPRVLIRPAPKQRGRLPVRLLPPTTRSSGCRAVPFPHRRPRRASSLTYAARFLAVRPLPIAVGRTADPTMAAGAHVEIISFPGRSKATHERGRCWWCSHTVGFHPDDRIRPAPAFPSSML
jgi:hypothetical protein